MRRSILFLVLLLLPCLPVAAQRGAGDPDPAPTYNTDSPSDYHYCCDLHSHADYSSSDYSPSHIRTFHPGPPDREFLVRVEPAQAQAVITDPASDLTVDKKIAKLDSAVSLKGTPLLVAIVIEGGEDRQFSIDVPLRFFDWFRSNTNLAGMMLAYAQAGAYTRVTTDYAGLRKAITDDFARQKPRRVTLWTAVLQARAALVFAPAQGDVRRLVLVITDPSTKSPQVRNLSFLNHDGVGNVVISIIQTHRDPHGPAGSELEKSLSPGLVFAGDFSHGQQLTDAQFDQQTQKLAAMLDELCLVRVTLLHQKPNLSLRLDSSVGARITPRNVLFDSNIP